MCFSLEVNTNVDLSDSQITVFFELHENDKTVDRCDIWEFKQILYYISKDIIKKIKIEDVIENIVDHKKQQNNECTRLGFLHVTEACDLARTEFLRPIVSQDAV